MHRNRRILIILILVAWTALAALGLSAMLRGRIEERLSSQVAEALAQNPGFEHVQAVFDGLNGRLDGRVGSPELKNEASELAKSAISAGSIGENQISVATRSPTVRARIDRPIVFLEGEVASSAARDELVRQIREITMVDEVRIEEGGQQLLRVTGEVKTMTWTPKLIEFLPRFIALCPKGEIEASDSTWAIRGGVEGTVQLNQLRGDLTKFAPLTATTNTDDLRLADVPAPKPPPSSTEGPTVAVGGPNTKPPDPKPKPKPEPKPEPIPKPEPEPEPEPKPEPEPEPEPEPAPPAATPEQLDELQEALAESTIYFERKSSYMKDSDLRILDKAIKVLNDFGAAYEIEVIGFADNIGDNSFNRWLAGQRSERIQEYLEENNIAVTRTGAEIVRREPGYKPTPAEAREDRRAELRVIRKQGEN